MPFDKGSYFCTNCAKKVFDFTQKTDIEIQNHIQKTGSACGVFLPSQLNRPLIDRTPKTSWREKTLETYLKIHLKKKKNIWNFAYAAMLYVFLLLTGCKVDNYAFTFKKSVQIEQISKANKSYRDSLSKQGAVIFGGFEVAQDVDYEGGDHVLVQEYIKHLETHPKILKKSPIFIDLHIDEKGKVYDVEVFNTNLNSKEKREIKNIGISKLKTFAPAYDFTGRYRKAVKGIILKDKNIQKEEI
jgi:hypothetical protein